MYILGVNESHNSSICLLKDGKILHAINEERFTRIKNDWGFPKQGFKYIMDKEGITAEQLDLVVLSFRNPIVYFHAQGQGTDNLAEILLSKISTPTKNIFDYLKYKFPVLERIYRFLYNNLYKPLFWPG